MHSDTFLAFSLLEEEIDSQAGVRWGAKWQNGKMDRTIIYYLKK